MDLFLDNDEILYVSFNQDHGCFAIGTEIGFKIYNTFPFKEVFSRDMGGGIGIVEMLYKTNFLALVGGGINPKFPLNKLIIWDDNQMKCVGEINFRSEVKAVKLRSNRCIYIDPFHFQYKLLKRIVVILDNKVFIYNFGDLKLLDHLDTCLNPKGLCSLNTDPENTILACPDKVLGHVTIHNYGNFGIKEKKRITNIKAHQNPLNALEINLKGNKLAVGCEKGTIIKIYNTSDGSLLQELRRSPESFHIHKFAFDETGRWLLCSSEGGLTHIFSLKLTEIEKADLQMQNENEIKNPKSKFAFMKAVLPFLDSEWDFASFKSSDSLSLATINQDNLIVVTYEGNYYIANFDCFNGGECILKKQLSFFIKK